MTKEPTKNNAGKSPALIVTTLLFWVGIVAVLAPPLIDVLRSASNIWEFLVLSMFGLMLAIFWVLSSYYVALTLFYLVRNKLSPTHEPVQIPRKFSEPMVAILYPTCNDFRLDAVMTCMRQDYTNCHTYILDDSTRPEFLELIDEFAQHHTGRVTVVRRPERHGFKAGNLNDGLHGVASSCTYFAVMDADELIPDYFVSEAVAELTEGDWAYVQARHKPYSMNDNLFSSVLSQSILPFWSLLLRLKNRWGFVPCVGHGVVFRYADWKAVGGFPELVSEDLAISSRLLAVGRRGKYMERLVCREEFPSSFAHYRKQQERYVTGVAQVLGKYGIDLLKSSHATVTEKIDFFLSCFPLFIPVLCLLFILLVGVLVPFIFGQPSEFVLTIGTKTFAIPYYLSVDGRFSPIWSGTFVLLSIICSMSPMLPIFALSIQRKVKHPVRLVVFSLVAQMSTMLSSAWKGIQQILKHKDMEFIPTGSQGLAGLKGRGKSVEVAVALLFTAVLLSTLNIGLASMALCPVLAIAIPLNSRLFRIGLAMVVLGVIGNFMLAAVAPLSSGGFLPFPFTIHF